MFPVNALSEEKCVIIRRMRKPRGLKKRRYAAHRIDIKKHLAILHGAKESNCFGVTELNAILLKSMSDSWSNHA